MSSENNFTPGEKKTALRIFWGHIRKSNRDQFEADKVKFLKKIPFFEGLKKSQLELVANIVYERNYSEGEFVFEIGQPGAALFIIQTGEVVVELPDPTTNNPTQLATVGKYSFFGELALMDESPRSASARAVVNTRVLALFRKDLDHLAESYPEVSSKIYKALAVIVGNRLKATTELIEKKLKVVA